MVRSALVFVLVFGFSSMSFSAQEEKVANAGPEIVTLKMGEKVFELKHWQHQKSAKKGGCTNCHRGEIGKIEGWNQEFAHMVCIPCHDLNDKGPVNCKDCHKKKK
jgi:hypothetical protein